MELGFRRFSFGTKTSKDQFQMTLHFQIGFFRLVGRRPVEQVYRNKVLLVIAMSAITVILMIGGGQKSSVSDQVQQIECSINSSRHAGVDNPSRPEGGLQETNRTAFTIGNSFNKQSFEYVYIRIYIYRERCIHICI